MPNEISPEALGHLYQQARDVLPETSADDQLAARFALVMTVSDMMATNAQRLDLTVEGVVIDDLRVGDWRILADRLDRSPAALLAIPEHGDDRARIGLQLRTVARSLAAKQQHDLAEPRSYGLALVAAALPARRATIWLRLPQSRHRFRIVVRRLGPFDRLLRAAGRLVRRVRPRPWITGQALVDALCSPAGRVTNLQIERSIGRPPEVRGIVEP